MKRLIPFLLFVPLTVSADYHPPVEYGVAVTVDFVLYNTDGTLDIDEVDGGTEVTIHCDGDAGTTATNDFVDEGSYYSIALTASETQCARVTLDIAATDRNVVVIPTWGTNASSQFQLDGPSDISAQIDTDNISVTLENDAITAAKIAAGAIGASEIATDAIGAAEIDADAIGAAEIADGAIDAAAVTGNPSVNVASAAWILASGTCDSGTTESCVDAALTQADDFWKGAGIIFTSGSADGETSCVWDFVASTDTLSFWATTTNINTESYVLFASPECEAAIDRTP